MYQVWYGKKGSGYCGNGEILQRWGHTTTDECPNCGNVQTASHLNVCPSLHRRKILQQIISSLADWMKDNYTHPELIEKVPEFLRAQGGKLFTDLGTILCSMWRIAHAADVIG